MSNFYLFSNEKLDQTGMSYLRKIKSDFQRDICVLIKASCVEALFDNEQQFIYLLLHVLFNSPFLQLKSNVWLAVRQECLYRAN